MDKKTAAERLRSLATDNGKRSKAARLRDIFDDVEMALAAGAKRADVLAELHTLGLAMSLSTFETTLRRLREKRRQHLALGRLTQPYGAPAPAPVTTSVFQPSLAENTATSSHDPADLDRIVKTRPDLAALARIAKRSKK
jgi:hypothetical protein